MDKLIKKIQTFSHQFNLWQEGDKIVVGVSGGPDSVCLLDILVCLAKKRKFTLTVAHVNYGLRGADSDKDEVFVRKLAQKYKLSLAVLDVRDITPPLNPPLREGGRVADSRLLKERGRVNLLKEDGRLSGENELRKIRYDFFEKIRKENNLDLIAVAHNQDDQAETILMRLIRGSGLMGLRSIRPKNNKIVRPLLDTSRQEIIAYLKENKLTYRIDKTNRESKFLRNKIRNNLIPLMEKEYNPILKETLAGSAGSIADDYDFIFESAKKVFQKINFDKDKNKYFFESKKFLKNHPAMQKQVLREIITNLRSNLLNVESAHLEEIIKIVKSDKNKSQVMSFAGLKIAKKGDIMYISIEK